MERPRLRRWWSAAVAIAQVAGRGALGMSLTGELPQTQDFGEYVGKFCFDYENSTEPVGTIKLHIERMADLPPQSGGKLFFMVYDDERMHWRQIRDRWSIATCEEKREAASIMTEVELWTADRKYDFVIHLRERIRPRFWYLTFVNCGADVSNVPIRYSIRTTNDKAGYQSEFSMDKQGLWKVYSFSTLGFSLVGVLAYRAARKDTQDSVLGEHPYVKLLLLSLAASCASSALFTMHYTMFMYDGFGSKRLRFLAMFSAIVANCTIYLIAILSSCGWAITTAMLPHRRSFLGLVTLVGGLHAVCELHAQTTLDQSARLDAYAGGVGLFALVLKVFIFCWFAFQARNSYDLELVERRRRFFKYLGTGISIWAMSVPTVVLLAFQVRPWARYKWVTGIEVLARFLGQCLLSQLFLGPLTPIDEENNFRVHGYQGGAMTDMSGGFGNLGG